MKIITERLKAAIHNIDSKYFVRNERDFAYEIYYQLRLLNLQESVELICETGKNRFNNGDTVFKDKKLNKIGKDLIAPENICRVPDILIHYYDNDNRKQQLLGIEIKKHPTISQIHKAFAKLAAYNKGNLRYQKSILFLFDFDKNKLSEIRSITELLKNHVDVWIIKPNKEVDCLGGFR